MMSTILARAGAAGAVTAVLALSALNPAMPSGQRPSTSTADLALAAATPGVPAEPVPVFVEDFQNRPGMSPIVRVPGYIGSSASGSPTYAADSAWLNNCNGWISAWNQDPSAAGQVTDCGARNSWNSVQQLAQALGIQSGKSAVAARDNFAVAAFTSADPGAGKVTIRTNSNAVLASASGRFLTTSIDVAAFSCSVRAPRLQFQLVDSGGTATNVGGEMNACANGVDTAVEARGARPAGTVRTGTYTSSGSLFWNNPSVGFRVINNEGSGAGNDYAFDNIRILDATPRLDKSFAADRVAIGKPFKLSFTMTNTSELAAKNGWSLTDNLAPGLKVAAAPNISTTCGSGVVTAPAGATKVSVTGNLDTGMTSCTASVDVVTDRLGDLSNGADNLSPVAGLDVPAVAIHTDAVDTDFGDAPASYDTAGASHTETAGLTLGRTRDAEVSATPGAEASGDGADEDSVTVRDVRSDLTIRIPVEVRNTTGAAATLLGWIDLNGDGDVTDAGEHAAGVPVPAGAVGAELTWPAGAGRADGDSFLRLRLVPGDGSGTGPSGAAVGGEIEDFSIALHSPALVLSKSASAVEDADGNGPDAGDVITYTLSVRNDGTRPLTDLEVSDPLLGGVIPCGTGELAGGDTHACPPVRYALTRADIEAGERTNTATARAFPDLGPRVTSSAQTSTPVDGRTAISLDKTHGSLHDVDGNGTDVGDSLDYSFVVANTGTVTLTGVAVDDPRIGAVSCPVDTLDPAETATCTASYALTQDDLDAGRVLNTATAAGTGRGIRVTGTDNDVLDLDAAASISLTKAVSGVDDDNGSGTTDVGDLVHYSLSIRNTGVMTVRRLAVTDLLVTTAGGAVTCPDTVVAPADHLDCTATYRITQGDVDHGSVENSASVEGESANGDLVAARDGTELALASESGIGVLIGFGEPADTDGDGRPSPGDTVPVTFTVSNTGSSTLTGLTVDDPKVAGIVCTPTTIAPGAQSVCTGTVVLTRDDVDRGSITSSPTVTARDPSGDPVTAPAASGSEPLDSAAAIEAGEPQVSLEDTDGSGGPNAGDTVVIRVPVRNTGDVTANGISLTGIPPGAEVTCPTGPLAPDEEASCMIRYSLTQRDVDSGETSFTPTLSAKAPSGEQVAAAPGDPVTVPTPARPALSASAGPGVPQDADHNGHLDPGDTVTVEITVTNPGNVTLHDLTVEDPRYVGVVCRPEVIAPGGSATCTATIALTRDDLEQGSLTSTPTVTGTGPDGAPVRVPAGTVSLALPAGSSIGLTKSARLDDKDGDSLADEGEVIGYSFRVVNTGSVRLTRVVVDDPMLAAAGVRVRCPASALEVGGTLTCTAAYVVRRADLGSPIKNVATARGVDARGHAVTSAKSAAIIEAGGEGRADGPVDRPLGLPDTGGPYVVPLLLGLLLLSVGGIVMALGFRGRHEEEGGKHRNT